MGDYRELQTFFYDHGTPSVFIRLRGYTNGNNDYQKAKQPIEKEWTNLKKSLTRNEIETWLDKGGWIGLIVPRGTIVVDIDRKQIYMHLSERLRALRINHIAIATPNGGQFLFNDTGAVTKQGAKIITIGGVVVDYRLAGKGQIIMPTENTEGRTIEYVSPDLDPMPTFFNPVRQFKEGKDEDILLPVPIREGQRDDTLFRHASRLREWNTKYSLGFSHEQLAEQVRLVNKLLCEPPLHEHTVTEKVESALAYSVSSTPIVQADHQLVYPYYIDENGYLCRYKEKGGEQISIRIANFSAHIVEEITEDNGLDRTHYFSIEGSVKGKALPRAKVSAAQFPSMAWVFKEWGNQAILEAGQSTKDFVRHAIQVQSDNATRLTVFTHTGWRQIDGKWVYLSAGGAIGADNVLVTLPEVLRRYAVPLTVDHEKEIEAIRTSLKFLELGNHELTYPLYALLWLSPLTTLLNPMPNFSGYAYGDTGTFKTTVALLQLSHFGDFSQANNLSNFDDTANAIEKKAFTLKDALLVLDDYHPSSKRQDAQNKEQLAQRLIREYSNRTARDRLNSDTTEKGRYTPRGMLLITGEELVQLQSTLARVLVLEFSKGDIDKNRLTDLQSNSDFLPYAMTSYIHWLQNNLSNIQQAFPETFRTLRTKASREGTHKKLPEQVAYLQFAFDTMLSWIVDVDIIINTEARVLSREAWAIFNTLSMRQSQRIADDEPIKKFIDTVQALIAQEAVKIEPKEFGAGPTIGGANGKLIGYYDDLRYYLLPVELWHEVQRYSVAEQSYFPLSKDTLYRRLAHAGFIHTENGRNTVNVRLRGTQRRILKFIDRGIFQNEVAEATHATKPSLSMV